MKRAEFRWFPLGISAGLSMSFLISILPEHLQQAIPLMVIVGGILLHVLISEDTRKS